MSILWFFIGQDKRNAVVLDHVVEGADMNMIHHDLKGKEKYPFLTCVNFFTKDLC